MKATEGIYQLLPGLLNTTVCLYLKGGVGVFARKYCDVYLSLTQWGQNSVSATLEGFISLLETKSLSVGSSSSIMEIR